ncbi:NAD(P)-dependent oxidoreductase [Nitrobacter sp. NHB1]|uniref:NAD(P)-dependent oxidoreductase n=1 Tax=Nitrobacter sp. NHB1 TaxID=3119830 RepID=UPI002FFFAECF
MSWLRTRRLVSRDDVARMTARGPIIDAAALQDRSVGDAGPKIFSQQPLPLEHPLRKLDNTVLTPHLGDVITENYRHYYIEMVEDIAAWLKGGPVQVLR